MNAVAGIIIDSRYTLVEQLGEGGMGQVFRAIDGLNRDVVALKRVLIARNPGEGSSSGGFQDSDGLRFALAQEFNTLASLRHPNVISVLDYGFDSERQPFFTMEFLAGARTFYDAAWHQPLPTKISLLVQVLQAVAYLHRRGVVHRDLKPANVMVTDNDVRVLDFGLSIGQDEVIPEAMQFAGTLAYIPPEVLRGQVAREPADLYAVGIMAYELLAGRHPFNSSNPGLLVNDILLTKPDLAPLEDIDFAGDIPPDEVENYPDTLMIDSEAMHTRQLESAAYVTGASPDDPNLLRPINLAQVVGKLLAKQPYERYQSADEVIDDLLHVTRLPIPTESQAIRESYLQAARFIGRDHELRRLIDDLAKAHEGSGSAWLIAGESGVGKSRMLDELRTRALVNGFLVLRGQAVAEGGLPYQLWRDPVRRLALGTTLSDLDAGILKDIVTDMDELQGRTIPPVAQIEGTAYQQRLLGTIASLFRQQTRPILLLLEDLQWAQESLDALKVLSGMSGELPLLIVASYREDERADLAKTLPMMQFMRLERLSRDHVADLSASILGDAGRQPQLLDFLQRETEGNIFFIVEVLRALAEEAGQLNQVTRITLPQYVIAGGIQAIMQRRLARVPEDGVELLRLAALAGRELDLAILSQIKSPPELEDWLLVCENGAVLEVHEEQWRFSHDKLRQATIASIPPESRPKLHRRIAQAIEQTHPNAPEQAATLAQHWRSADDPLRERLYRQRAGEYALSLSVFNEAINHLERALELLDATLQVGEDAARIRADIQLQIGEALKYLGSYTEADDHVEAALNVLREQDDQPGIARALLELGDLIIYQGDYQRAWQLCEESGALYRSLEHQEGIARSLDRQGLIRFHQGDYTAAIGLCDEGLALSRSSGDSRGIASAINNLGMAAFAQGNYAAATGYFEETLALCRASGERRKAAAALLNLGSAAGEIKDYDASGRYLEESLTIFQSIGERRGVALALDNLGVVAEHLADYHRAIYYYDQSLEMAQAIGNKRGVANALVNLGNASRALGETERAHQSYVRALQAAREIEATPTLLEALTGLAGLNVDARQSIRWIGLVLNHNATFEGTRKAAEPILSGLIDRVPAGDVEVLMAEGQALELEQVVAGLLESV